MASSLALHSLLSISTRHSPNRFKTQPLSLAGSRSLPSASTSRLNCQTLLPRTRIGGLRTQRRRSSPVVFASQTDLLRVLQTVWGVGKDGIDVGTKLVPDSVPRPVARISVTVVALTVGLFVLKSFLSTAFFVLGMMGLIYFVFLALNKDEGPKGGGGGGGGGTSSSPTTSVDESLEEARRIMEKYK